MVVTDQGPHDGPVLRADVLTGLVGRVRDGVAERGRCVVAVDGADGAGKSRFAADLVVALVAAGVPAAGASADGFHRPRAERYARGRSSPEGYLHDAFDLAALERELLGPWRHGRGAYRSAVHDVGSDLALDLPPTPVPAVGALVVDGVFLLRDELVGQWDLAVRLEVPAAERFRRMAARDGSPADPQHPDNRRYLLAHHAYEQRCDPVGRADVVLDATSWDDLRVLRGRP